MSFENDPRSDAEYDEAYLDDAYDADEAFDERNPRRWTRWLPIAIAALVLIFGITSLVFSIVHRADQDKEAEIEALRNTIASEETQLENLQEDYDAAAASLAEKQDEYDEAIKEAESGATDSAGSGAKSLEALKEEAAQAQSDYSAALEAYDKAVDGVEQTAPGYDDAKNKLSKLQPFLSYATAYQQFEAGTTDELPGINPEEWEDGVDAQEWYTMMVYPAGTQAGFTFPSSVEEFPAAVQQIAAEPAARVKAYEDALAASKAAEAKLAEANTAQEEALAAYTAAKEAEKTSEDWLTECEQEISRLEKRVQDLEQSIADTQASLDQHRAQLKELENA